MLGKSNPKTARPISTKHAMHFVLKSSRARGQFSLLKKQNSKKVNAILKKQARRWGIRLYRYENVGNHIHLLVKATHRKGLLGYLRSITGLIARAIMGVERGRGRSLQFWDARPFSRVVAWGRSYRGLHRYLDNNRLQAVGFSLTALAQELAAAGVDTG